MFCCGILFCLWDGCQADAACTYVLPLAFWLVTTMQTSDLLERCYPGNRAQMKRAILYITPVLPTGVIVLIPVLEQAAAATVLQDEELPPWKR